jgi:mono/diheme cytochrome c family protein
MSVKSKKVRPASRAFPFCFVGALLWWTLEAALPAAVPERVDFNHQIKPLLSDRCYACHGPDEKSRKAKLRLDTPEGAFKALPDGGWIIQPGQPSKSELIRRILSTDPEVKMPPPDSKLALGGAEVELIRRWVEQGAEWQKHWAFIPVGQTPVPSPRVPEGQWRNEIDHFVVARLVREGLPPAPEATKEHLIRRISFDLTGLPPTLAEVDRFVADSSSAAYERVVDRLLTAPAYGERMAVDWLDVARYADTYGYQSDRFNHLWPWRDWVISAFNRNVRINEFIVWQIAGDLLPEATREQRLATAFNRLHRQTNEGGSVDEEFRVEYNADRVHTMAGAFLGLTLECARCHDHKFDPITQRDYYRLFAFFNSTDESGLYSHFTDAIPSPTVLLFPDDAEERKHRALQQAIVRKQEELAARRDSAGIEFAQWRAQTKELPPLGGLIGHYPFDSISNNKTPSALGTNHPASSWNRPGPPPGNSVRRSSSTGRIP